VTDYGKPMVRGLAFVRAVPYHTGVGAGTLDAEAFSFCFKPFNGRLVPARGAEPEGFCFSDWPDAG
jgi:hypothetical protein